MKHLLFIFLVITLLLSACRPDCDKLQEVKVDDFYSTYTGIMPFTGIEEWRFLKNQKDTVTFKGQSKEIWYEEVLRGGGDCEIIYQLLNHRVVFKDIKNTGRNLSIHYYKWSETNNFQDFFIMEFGNIKLAPKDVISMYVSMEDKLIDINVLGRYYTNVVPLSLNLDSIYMAGQDAMHQIIRIKNQSDIYELIP